VQEGNTIKRVWKDKVGNTTTLDILRTCPDALGDDLPSIRSRIPSRGKESTTTKIAWKAFWRGVVGSDGACLHGKVRERACRGTGEGSGMAVREEGGARDVRRGAVRGQEGGEGSGGLPLDLDTLQVHRPRRGRESSRVTCSGVRRWRES